MNAVSRSTGAPERRSRGSHRSEHFAAYQRFFEEVEPRRKRSLHLVAVAGGEDTLNLIALLRPRHLSLVDHEPEALRRFGLLQRTALASRSADEFLRNVRRRVASKRSDVSALEQRWEFALTHFEALQRGLRNANTQTRLAEVRSPEFKEWVGGLKNAWIYFSDVYARVREDWHLFRAPSNTVLMFASPGGADARSVLDLSDKGEPGHPLRIYCKRVARTSNPIWYRDSPDSPGLSVRVSHHPMDRFQYLDSEHATPLYAEIANIIQTFGYRKVLDIGCKHGRITEFLDKSYSYVGFDIVAPAIRRARLKVRRTRPDCDFRFLEADWNNPPPVDAEVIVFGGVFHYIKDRLAFLERYRARYNPKLIIIADIKHTDFSSIRERYACTEQMLYLRIKRRYRRILTISLSSSSPAPKR